MTPLQEAAVLAAIQAEPANAALIAAGDDRAVHDWLNSESSVVVWRESMSVAEMVAQYDWTEMGTLTAPQFYQLSLVTQPGTINPADPSVREMLAAVFAGAGFATTRGNLISAAKRPATHFEAALATGTGTTANPATMGRVGVISINETVGVIHG